MSHLPKSICVRVMAEYASSGTWEFIQNGNGPWRHTMVSHERLGLSRELSERFKAWLTTYENKNMSGELDCESFNATGISLAYAIYEELNKDHYVEFQGEAPDGGIEEAIDISSL